MKKRIKSKKLKGMTLVEVLVAMAVFGVLSAMLASSVLLVIRMVDKTDRLNKKIVKEAPAAEVQNCSSGIDEVITIIVNSESGNPYNVNVKKYEVNDESSIYEEGGNFKYFKPGTP